jgi:hypothetical protein
LPLWTTNSHAVDVQLRFIPTMPGVSPTTFDPFAGFRLSAVDPRTARTTLTSLVPLLVRVRADAPVWLETPRMYLPHYTATIADESAPVRAGPSGLTTVAVPAGASDVIVKYQPPVLLRLSYFATGTAWLGLGAASLLLFLKRNRRSFSST